MNKIALQLKKLAIEYRLRPIRVMVVKDYGTITVDGVEYTLSKGAEIEVPRWLADVLEEMGVANPVERGLDIEDITRVHFSTLNARTPAELEPLPRDFYLEALRYIERLSARVKKEFDASLLEEQQKAMRYLLEIIDRRLTLILQSIRSPTSIAEISSKLSPEELVLLNSLRESLETWQKSLSPRLVSP